METKNICPDCKKPVQMPPKIFLNLENYNNDESVLVVSKCCGIGYTVKREISYKIALYEGLEKEDYWGVALKPNIK